jgi:hypothetical protein
MCPPFYLKLLFLTFEKFGLAPSDISALFLL